VHDVSLLKPAEVARRLGVSWTWLYEAARTGPIPSIRLGGERGPLRFLEADLDDWLARSRSTSRPGYTDGSIAQAVAIACSVWAAASRTKVPSRCP
jgi:excisionase family DNA binding protein